MAIGWIVFDEWYQPQSPTREARSIVIRNRSIARRIKVEYGGWESRQVHRSLLSRWRCIKSIRGRTMDGSRERASSDYSYSVGRLNRTRTVRGMARMSRGERRKSLGCGLRGNRSDVRQSVTDYPLVSPARTASYHAAAWSYRCYNKSWICIYSPIGLPLLSLAPTFASHAYRSFSPLALFALPRRIWFTHVHSTCVTNIQGVRHFRQFHRIIEQEEWNTECPYKYERRPYIFIEGISSVQYIANEIFNPIGFCVRVQSSN